MVETDDIVNGAVSFEKLNKELQEAIRKSGGCNCNPDGSGGAASGDAAVYEPTMGEETEVNNAIGSIENGTALSELKGKTFSKIIDMMLVKEVWDETQRGHVVQFYFNGPFIGVVGEPARTPVAVVRWNDFILPAHDFGILEPVGLNGPDGVGGSLDVELTGKTIIYDIEVSPGLDDGVATQVGDYKFTLRYSYAAGYYDVISNLGNRKRIDVPAVSNAVKTLVYSATYPWYMDGVRQELVPVNTQYTVTKELSGSPVIKIPGINSTINVQADLGLGFMDVEWERSTEHDSTYDIDYIVYRKADSYQSGLNTPHKITFIIKL